MSYHRSYFSKNNTIIKNSQVNTAKNPNTEIFYGSGFSKFIFQLDLEPLKNIINGGQYVLNSNTKHILHLTNTIFGDEALVGKTKGNEKERATSFDLVLFNIPQYWDEGVGFDYEEVYDYTSGNMSFDIRPSNWNSRTTLDLWAEEGIYSAGVPSGATITTIHFDNGNEDINVDITNYLNTILSGAIADYGIGISFNNPYIDVTSEFSQSVAFFTKYTQTFFEPYIETVFDDRIDDNRENFFIDVERNLYLYVNYMGNAYDLDELPTVDILDYNSHLIPSLTGLTTTKIRRGVYKVSFGLSGFLCDGKRFYYDKWCNIKINGANLACVTQKFVPKPFAAFFDIGTNLTELNRYAIQFFGVNLNEKIKRGTKRKIVTTFKSINRPTSELIDEAFYRIYIKEGKTQVNIFDWTQMDRTNENSFMLDTSFMIPREYWIEIKARVFNEDIFYRDEIKFEIISEKIQGWLSPTPTQTPTISVSPTPSTSIMPTPTPSLPSYTIINAGDTVVIPTGVTSTTFMYSGVTGTTATVVVNTVSFTVAFTGGTINEEFIWDYYNINGNYHNFGSGNTGSIGIIVLGSPFTVAFNRGSIFFTVSGEIAPSSTPSMSESPSASSMPTPSISESPSVTPSASLIPTPSISESPSVTPSITPSASPVMYHPFQLEITTGDINQSLQIPILEMDEYDNPYIYNFTIDWGDGTPISTVSGYTDYDERQHTYVNSGVYTLSISGTCETFYDDDDYLSYYVTNIIQWGNIGIKKIYFYNYSFTSLPSDISGSFSNVTKFENSFENCGNLVTIPSNLFRYCTGVTSFSNTFNSCGSLAIPAGLFDNCPNVTSFQSTFTYCYGLTSIPSGLFDNCPNVTSFQSTFTYCNELTSIPSGLFDNCPNVTSFQSTFTYCYGLTSIPSGLFDNCPNVTSFQSTFTYCNELTSIPSGLFDNCPNVINFVSIFEYCTHLTSIPNGLFNNCPNVIYFDYAFYGCYDLIGDAPELWNIYSGATGSDCFSGCELLDNYLYIPISWGGLGLNPIFTFELNITGHPQSITIPHYSGYTHNYTVDYGDGSPIVNVASWDDPGCTHVYAGPGYYTVLIAGTCETFYVNGKPIKTSIDRVLNWGNTKLKHINFDGCANLTSIASDGLGLKLITDFSQCFNGCTSLASIPYELFDRCVINSFLNTFNGCTSLMGDAPHLWETFSGATGTSCFSGCLGLENYQYIPVSWGGLGNIESRLKMELNVSNNQTIRVPHEPSYIHDYMLDYGDGTLPVHITAWNDTGCTHTYTNAGIYILKISGICESFFVNYDTGINSIRETIRKVVSWGNVGILRLDYYGATNLVWIPNDYIGGLSGVTSFGSTFNTCSSLRTIPSGLFSGCVNVVYFTYAFANCTSLTAIPSGLFDNCPLVTNFLGLFWGCSKLESVPSGLFDHNTLVSDFRWAFQSCSHLITIPAGLFDNCSAVTTFQNTFADCYSMTSIPSNLFANCSLVDSFNATFANCYLLTSIPSGLFSGCTIATNFTQTFSACTSLMTIPSELFATNTAAVFFYQTFKDCSSLTTIPSGLFDNCIVGGEFSYAFADCYAMTSIPSGLFNNNPLASSFSNTFENCSSLTAIPYGLFDHNTEAYDFSYTFYNCSSLTTIPSGLFSACTGVTNFNNTFESCYRLTTIPSGLFDSCINVSNFIYTFRECELLTTIPSNLFNCVVPVNFEQTFEACYALTTLPSNLFNCSGQTHFNSTFSSCSNLITIPSNTFNCYSSVTFNNTFGWCASLTGITSGLFDNCGGVTDFQYAFGNCRLLASIPPTLFNNCPNVTIFANAFYNCYSLIGDAPDLWVAYPSADGNGCFYGDIGLSNYVSIPSGWK